MNQNFSRTKKTKTNFKHKMIYIYKMNTAQQNQITGNTHPPSPKKPKKTRNHLCKNRAHGLTKRYS
uniref:Uncharacterized protein n=1 Tax=Anguilla anguilla TaxID=7936 RepID=A0A0E9X2B3_ANGAN